MSDIEPKIPEFFKTLSDDDQRGYWQLQGKNKPSSKGAGGREKAWVTILLEIWDWIFNRPHPHNIDAGKRVLVCGIVFLTDAFLIKRSRLQIVTCKRKSAINGCCQNIGYGNGFISPESKRQIMTRFTGGCIPAEVRGWTLRGTLAVEITDQNIVQNLATLRPPEKLLEIAAKFTVRIPPLIAGGLGIDHNDPFVMQLDREDNPTAMPADESPDVTFAFPYFPQ